MSKTFLKCRLLNIRYSRITFPKSETLPYTRNITTWVTAFRLSTSLRLSLRLKLQALTRPKAGTKKGQATGSTAVTVTAKSLSVAVSLARVKDRHGNYSQGLIKMLTVEMKSEVPNTPQGFAVTFGSAATFNWLEVRNADIDFYEIRYDLNPGQEVGRIGKSTNTTYVGTVTERTGRVYLYAHNPIKGYSAPAMLEYNVKIPKVPTHIMAKGGMSGIGVTFDPVPLGCRGANVYVDDAVYFTPTNSFSLILAPGVYRVRVAYTDIFGEGEKSGEQLATVKLEIDKSIISREALGLDEIDRAIAKIESDVGVVRSEVTGTSTRITQLSNSVDLRLNSLDGKELISRINLSPTGTRIDGKLLHVTGQALFDDNIVTPKMIQAGAVTADKMHVESLSAISATIGTLRTAVTGQRVEIHDNLIEVYDENNQLRVRLGVWE